jgi:DNA-binding NarL/FixJ family response regulator
MGTLRNLTQRDLDLLDALVTERTMTDVAGAMFLSQRQTRRLVSDLIERLGVTSSRAAVALAAARGWIGEPASNLAANSDATALGPIAPRPD